MNTADATLPVANAGESPALHRGGVPMASSPAARAAIWLVRGYKRFLSRPLHLVLGPQCGCRFSPTCSEYAWQAFATHGFWRGGWLALRRLLRCNPFFAGGVDEVPPVSVPPPLPFRHR